MTQSASAQSPLEIERVQSSRSDAGEIRLRLSGRWLGPRPAADDPEELLVVQVEGRRHRFPASRGERDDATEPGRWSASFTLPAWAEPRRHGQAALWVGSAVVPVPPSQESYTPEPPEVERPPEVKAQREVQRPPEVEAQREVQRPPVPAAEPAPWSPGGMAGDTPRAGPLADLLFKETVAALHSELEQRTADAARVRGALADAKSELEARAATQAQLEATLTELRGELGRLIDAVQEQRRALDERTSEADRERAEFARRLAELDAAQDERAAEVAALRDRLASAEAVTDRRAAQAASLREELASANVSREAAGSEIAGLRAELGRIGTELAVTRERVGSESGDLGEANRLLADAKALAEQLRTGRGED